MNRVTIAIDCDDVIVPTAPYIIDHYNRQYGTSLAPKHMYTTDFEAWGVREGAEAIKRVNEYMVSDEYQQVEPFQEAIEVVRLLSQYHDLHIVTGRPDFLAEATERMLHEHFPDIFGSVEFTNFFGEKARPKQQVCKELGADLLIDDHVHHAVTVAECGIDVLLFGDYAWNQADTLPPNVRRVSGWREVAQLLLPQTK